MSRIVLYTKTLCSYCHRAKELLEMKGASYEEIDILKNEERFDEMVGRSGGKTTVPQIFINNKHVGGYDDLLALEIKGKLDELLKD